MTEHNRCQMQEPAQEELAEPTTPKEGKKRQKEAPLKRALTIQDTAAMLSVSTRSVRRLIDRDLLKPVLVFRKKLIPSIQIDRLLGEEN